MPSCLTFALVGGLVQDGLGGHDFPIPDKNNDVEGLGWKTMFTFNISIATLLRHHGFSLNSQHPKGSCSMMTEL